MHVFSNYVTPMYYTSVKLKLLKITLLGAFGAGIVATIIAKEMCKKKKAEDIND